MRLIPVQPAELDEWLPRLEWHFRSFCRSGQMQPEELVADVRSRDRQLWVVWDGSVRAAVLTLVLDDAFSTVQVSHCAGEGYGEWLHLIRVIEDWARDIGAKSFELIARPGWERPLREYGLRKTHVVMEKRL